MPLELLELRQENSKTFGLGDRKRQLEVSVGAIHYKNNYATDKDWLDIDLTFVNGRITKAPYTLEVNDLTITLTSKRTGTIQMISLDRIGANPPQRPVKWEFAGNQASVKNIAPATDLVIEAGTNLIRFKRVLHNASAPLEANFTHSKVIGSADDIILIVEARDADGEPLEVTKTDVGGKLTEKLADSVDLSKVKYPIEIDPSPLIVQPSAKDTCVAQNAPTTNYGTLTLVALEDRNGYTKRIILEFDISALPAGQTLTSANLQLNYYVYAGADVAGKTAWAYKLTKTDWVEAQATWNIYKTGSNWTTAGGDYTTGGDSQPAGGSTTFPSSYDWMTWSVLAICQDAYAGSIAAEFLLKFETEGLSSGNSSGSFYSKEGSPGDTTLRPKLTIAYTAGGTTYDETGKLQVILASQGKQDVMILPELGKEQVILATQGRSDTLVMDEVALEETVVIAQGRVDSLILGEIGKEQVILVAQGETDVYIPAGGSVKNLYAGGFANANRFDRRGW